MYERSQKMTSKRSLLLPLLCFSSLAASQSFGSNCYTDGGPSPGKPCVFPFTFEGETHYGCPPDLKEPGKTWCSTKTDELGNHVTGQNEFGFCGPECPKTECLTVGGPKTNAPCIFPFKFEGKTYNGCPPDLEDPTKRWCSTRVDATGTHVPKAGEFGHCGPDCPIDDGGLTEPGSTTVHPACPGHEVCLPFVQCSAQLSPNEAEARLCNLAGGADGVCCKEISSLGDNLVPFRKPVRVGIRSLGALDNDVVLRAVDIGESVVQNVTTRRTQSNTIRDNRSPEAQHAMFTQASPGVMDRSRLCLIAMETARRLALDQGQQLGSGVEFDFSGADFGGSPFQAQCPPEPACDRNSKYRTIDGSCNNLRKPKLGQAFTPLQRILPNAYADGLVLPRVANDGTQLPSARLVSTRASGQNEVDERRFTSMLVGFGQFLDHDFDHVPVSRSASNEAIECCTPDNQFREIVDPVFCFPIRIPPDDAFTRGRKSCINVVRSVCALNIDCVPGPIEQVNQITHWLDNSNVYGSTDEVARSLRSFKDGLLKTEPCQNGRECLPFTATDNCRGPTRRCGLAGDLRVNEQPTLSTLHLLFVREHNRLARQLKRFNPQWNDERLYQEARRILNAEWQHVVFNEFLPILLGNKFVQNFNLVPLTKGHSNVYRDDFDPSVSNAFAAAAFRIGHTLITSVIKMFRGQSLTKSVDLKTQFFNADIIREGSNFDEILAGLTMQPSEAYDANFVEDVKDHLFDEELLGIDLIAINMQRGRDHGLPGYVQYRRICRPEERINTFEDLRSDMTQESISKLKSVYKHLEDIDLFMGMSHEKPCRNGQDGALIGCTFVCIIGDNFARARFGDRFFYDLPNQPHSFTEDQLNQIRKVSLARIICDNSNINSISPLAFRQPNTKTNQPTACKSRLLFGGIPSVDLSVFKE